MAYTSTGLYNNGHTQYFNLQYDDSLSSQRGRDLANDLMNYCDADFLVLSQWFPSVFLHTPFTVTIANVSSETDTGATWFGWGPVPLEITLNLGTFPVTMGTPTTLARYLLVVETSEVFMRERQPYFFNRFNSWFEAFDEGSKGEALSCFLGVQFLLSLSPRPTAIPGIGSQGFTIASEWLNSPSTRVSSIDTNPDDIRHNTVTGCALLFLFFLHDQLGFSVNKIIDAGDATLADVYANLTGDSKTNAFTKFATLVNSHYPQNALDYFPPLDNIFPVPDLNGFTAPAEVSWVANAPFSNRLAIFVTREPAVDIKIMLASDDPSLISLPADVIMQSGKSVAYRALNVQQQTAAYTPKTVKLTATYAGISLTQAVRVVPPELLTLPPLTIAPKPLADPCAFSYFTEGSSLEFLVTNLDVIYNQVGLVYSWVVNGAAATGNASPVLSVSPLPTAGTTVKINVTVTNSDGIHASGTFTFTTVKAKTGVAELEQQVLCHINNLRAINLHVPPWAPVERAGTVVLPPVEQLTKIEEQTIRFVREAENMIASIQKLRSWTGVQEK